MKKLCTALSKKELINILAVARGDLEADLLIKNITVLDVVMGGTYETSIAISGRTIAGVGPEYKNARSKQTFFAEGLFAAPGFIDSHLHIESSMMHPFEFEALTLPLGVTSIISDPHEITNVLGVTGMEWFLNCCRYTTQNQFIQISSCIPALADFETNGSNFTLKNMIKYIDNPYVLGMAEVMNFPGVITGDDNILDKLQAFSHLNIDGHAPALRGKDLSAYIAAGISSCHETISIDEAREKLQKGMSIMIREGTVAKNLKSLAPIITEFNSLKCMICTDDRNPEEIINNGHINTIVYDLINKFNTPLHIAYRVASYSTASHFSLKRVGIIAPGAQADLLILNDLKSVDIKDVLIKGQFVSELNLSDRKKISKKLKASNPPTGNSIKRNPVVSDDFNLRLTDGTYNIIEIVPKELITNHIKREYSASSNKFYIHHNGKEDNSINFISIIERYGNEEKIVTGLVKGFNMKNSAISSSVAHDSHNIITIGDNIKDITNATNSVIQNQGGLSISIGGKIKESLPLQIAGLISTQSALNITNKLANLNKYAKKAGITIDAPFLQMAFLALPVIPSLKITNKGLINVDQFKLIDLKE